MHDNLQHTRSVSALAFSFDGTRLYSAGLDGSVVLHDFQVQLLGPAAS